MVSRTLTPSALRVMEKVYQSIYYWGDGSDLTEWVVLEDHAGFAPQEDAPRNPFEDVFETDWYYKAVLWAAENGVTSGVDQTHFNPRGDCTRELIVSFLWAAAGRPEPPQGEAPFSDVKAEDYYYNAVLWAVEKGVTAGVGDGRFGVGQSCTREQAMTFLWAAAGRPEPPQGEAPFSDLRAEDYYYKAVLWAVEKGVTAGVGDGRFGVGQSCIRAEIVTFLYCLLGK